MGIRCRGCVDVMWGRQTLLSCLKTNDLLTWLSPDDTFPPPHQHQYLGRLNYQNGPLLSLLGYKVKKNLFLAKKKNVPLQTSSNSLLDRIFLAPDLLLINVLILTFFPLPDVLSYVSYFLFSPFLQTYFTPEGPALTKAGGGPFAFCACKYQIVVLWLCCYVSLQWNDIVALFAYICLRPDLVFRAF